MALNIISKCCPDGKKENLGPMPDDAVSRRTD